MGSSNPGQSAAPSAPGAANTPPELPGTSSMSEPSGVDGAAFAAFDMQALSADDFDARLASAGDALSVVFFWGLDCFNCAIAKKAMLAQPDAIRALGLKWFHSNVYAHPALARRFVLHGVPTWFFFHRGKRLGRATGWHGLTQFQAAVAAARDKIAAAGGG